MNFSISFLIPNCKYLMAERRNLREIGENPRPIRPDNPISEIATDIANERRTIIAEYFGPGLPRDEYLRQGFPELGEDETIVFDLQSANFIEHITVDGERKLYGARNFRLDKYDPENLLEAKDITDESVVDPENIIKLQLEALRTGGKYRFIYKRPNIATRTGGAFLWFLREEFLFSLSKYGMYKKSEWKELKDIEIFNSCLVHCFKDHKYYERVLYSKASIYTLCSKKIFAIIADMTESNIIVHKIKVDKNETKQNNENYTEIRKITYYGSGEKKYKEDFHICLLQGHYFPFISNTGFTTRYIKHCVWKDKEKDPKKLKTKYGLYKSKTSVLNSFNLIKLMIEMRDEYFEDFNSEILKEPRKEVIDDQIMFKDYEQFDVGFDSRPCPRPKDDIPDEFEEILDEYEGLDEEDLFNNLINKIESKTVNSKFKEKEIFHGDIETRPNKEGRHIPYLMAYSNNEGSQRHYFWGENCVRKCLNHLTYIRNINKKTVMKFQNLGFDITQIRDELLRVLDSVEPSKSKVYRLNGVYNPGSRRKAFPIIFADQYLQIPMRLDSYEISFDLVKGKTKGFRHDFYANIKTIDKRYLVAPHSCYSELIKIFEKKYINNSIDGKRLLIDYRGCAIDYCQQDVETQRQGWNKMWQQVNDELDIDYNRYMTISNLSKGYCLKEGCYDDVYEIRGKTALFIRKCVIGGRTMVALHNKKNAGIRILNEREGDENQNGFDFKYEDETIYPEKDINDIFIFHEDGEYDITLNENKNKKERKLVRGEAILEKSNNSGFISPRPKLGPYDKIEVLICLDVNSLYPYAIVLLNGYPIGPPKNIPIEDLKSKKFMEYANEYYLKILIKKVKNKLDFPILTKTGENGERLWINDMEGEEVYVDRISLEEIMEHHGIEFEVKTGVMFDEGYNNKIGKVVKKLYELRTKYKKEKNPVQLLYKLMLNTAYGKTIQKPKDSRIIWRENTKTSEKNLIKTFGESIQYISTSNHSNMFKAKIRIGILNHWAMPQCGSLVLSQSKRIMNKFLVEFGEYSFYTDTDSVFITETGYNILKEKYPEVLGDELGQLKEENHLKGERVRITKAMFLAPKTYWVREENEKGEIYDKFVMKGIPQSSIEKVLKQKFNGNPETLFYALINRKNGVLFDLLDGGDKVRMDFSTINAVINLDKFSRRIGGFK